MKRELQLFNGTLTDKELYLIEDALKAFNTEEAKNLIDKLYVNFSEVR